MGIFKNHVLRNLFSGMPNDKLQKCYRSRRASLIAGETIGIWKDMIGAYKEFVIVVNIQKQQRQSVKLI